MIDHPDWSRHSPYSSPGRCAALLEEVPTDVARLSEVARNVIVHYRASGTELPAHSRDDVDCRWLEVILQRDQERHAKPLTEPRELTERVQGCCRDHTLFCVGVLRQHGIPARSLVGFAAYSAEQRWVRFDPEIAEPTERLHTPHDIPTGPDAPFLTAAEVWKGCRSGDLDPGLFGAGPGSEFGGMWFVHNDVLLQLAHRYGDELLLWDGWGAFATPDGLDGSTLELVDELADLLIAVESDNAQASMELLEAVLRKRYDEDDRLRPGTSVTQYSPYGEPPKTVSLARSRI